MAAIGQKRTSNDLFRVLGSAYDSEVKVINP